MRALLAFILTFIIAFSAQINTLAGGAPVELNVVDDYYVTAAGGMLYVFDSTGEVVSYLTISSLSDFEIVGDTIIVTTTSQDFPNIRAFTFPDLTPKWEFEPMMEIFDTSLVWSKKQTRSWAVKGVSSGIGVASGYTLYILSADGSLLGNFTTGSDVWDFVEIDGNYYLATQEGVIYIIDSNFEGAYSVYAEDLDGDGIMDVLGAASIAGEISWWENDGIGNFTKHVIDSNFDGACSYMQWI